MKTTPFLAVLLLQGFGGPALAEDWNKMVTNFKTAFTKCGESYFFYLDRGSIPTQSDYVEASQRNIFGTDRVENDRLIKRNQDLWKDQLNEALIELKGVSFTVKPKPRQTKATLADALNGRAEREGQVWHDWDITLTVHSKAIRSREIKDGEKWSWGEWGSGGDLSFFISKNKDTIKYSVGSRDENKKIDDTTVFFAPRCDAIPGECWRTGMNGLCRSLPKSIPFPPLKDGNPDRPLPVPNIPSAEVAQALSRALGVGVSLEPPSEKYPRGSLVLETNDKPLGRSLNAEPVSTGPRPNDFFLRVGMEEARRRYTLLQETGSLDQGPAAGNMASKEAIADRLSKLFGLFGDAITVKAENGYFNFYGNYDLPASLQDIYTELSRLHKLDRLKGLFGEDIERTYRLTGQETRGISVDTLYRKAPELFQ